MDAQRALLDELMGTARNLTEEQKKGYREIRWDDKEVCAFYMVRFCPHDLFVNTRSDLGPCPRVHDQKLKDRTFYAFPGQHIFFMIVLWDSYFKLLFEICDFSFEKSPRHDAYVPKFEAELAQFCEKLVMDLDRRVRRGQERLAQEVETAPLTPLSAEKSEQLFVLEEKIKNLLEQVETLGEAGKVDEAEVLMRKEKKMALCEVCGSFLAANDAAERTQSHVTGKQHIGYGMVRDFFSEFKEAKAKAKEEEILAREKEVEEQRKQREKEYENRRRRSGSGDRDKYRDRDKGRDRYWERDLDRERSREWNGRGSRDGERDWRYKNGGDGGRDRHQNRRRSRSPGRHSHRRSSRSPVHRY
ncbi:luc7-like protein 3 isoform X2 [Durio zibethinus]|uniref:Luc7-like protein 3 isoform X2 n=1 Tax=Durio zibethinus TaxID=66656 RepID=A0A6P5XSD8_DURZI|nr:luc7-like protein 3 isoform X2 [Durio zibethinus]